MFWPLKNIKNKKPQVLVWKKKTYGIAMSLKGFSISEFNRVVRFKWGILCTKGR